MLGYIQVADGFGGRATCTDPEIGQGFGDVLGEIARHPPARK